MRFNEAPVCGCSYKRASLALCKASMVLTLKSKHGTESAHSIDLKPRGILALACTNVQLVNVCAYARSQ